MNTFLDKGVITAIKKQQQEFIPAARAASVPIEAKQVDKTE